MKTGTTYLAPGTEVWATASIEQGMRGTVSEVDGDLRRVSFEHWWAWLAIWQLQAVLKRDRK